MPSTYAHYKLGQEVRELLDEKDRAIIEDYLELYLIGLHGPDILFYYKPLHSNPVNRTGHEIHEQAGAEFFEQAARVIAKHHGHRAYIAYVYGVICHFALDVTCHAYIDEKIRTSRVTHAEIEVEFDRELMIMDGYNPVEHRLTGHIAPTTKNAAVIREFYPTLTTEEVRHALQGMIFYHNVLHTPHKGKRNVLYTLLKIAGKYEEMKGQFVGYEKNPDCTDSTDRLLAYFPLAENLAVRLIKEYRLYFKGIKSLNENYRYNFGGVMSKEITHEV